MRKQKKTIAFLAAVERLKGSGTARREDSPAAANTRFTLICGVILLTLLCVYHLHGFFDMMYVRHDTDSMNVTLYYVSPAESTLRPEVRGIKTPASNLDLISAVLTELIKDPLLTGNARVFPRDSVILESAAYNENNSLCSVNLTQHYLDLPIRDQLFIRAAVAMTLTEFDFINGVIFRTPEGELTGADNLPIGAVSRENMSLNPALSPFRTNTRSITLYFIDESGARLVPEARTIEVSGNIELHIVEQLIAGPAMPNARPALLSDLTLKSATTSDGICYVDFAPGFLSRQLGGEYDMLAVYSIVNSLTELSSIQKVQIIADSAIITEKISDSAPANAAGTASTLDIDLSIPLLRNEELIK